MPTKEKSLGDVVGEEGGGADADQHAAAGIQQQRTAEYEYLNQKYFTGPWRFGGAVDDVTDAPRRAVKKIKQRDFFVCLCNLTFS